MQKNEKKPINDGLMYVCVAEKCEMMVFFGFFFNTSFDRQFSAVARKKTKNTIRDGGSTAQIIGFLGLKD